MAQKIRLKLKGKEYVLEYDRQQFSKLENAGFSIQRAIEQPLNYGFGTFKYAILKNEPSLSDNQLNSLFDEFVTKYDLSKFIEWAQEIYASFFNPIQSNSSKEEMEFFD